MEREVVPEAISVDIAGVSGYLFLFLFSSASCRSRE